MDKNLTPSTISTNLLDLPVLVATTILKHLDIGTLKKLRLVSKLTKEWVEEAIHIQKFMVHINNVEIRDKLFQSTVPWNNFLVCINPKELLTTPTFINKYGPLMKHLQIIPILDCNICLDGIGTNNFVTLAIKTLRFNSVEHDTSKFWMRNLVNLKTLVIGCILHIDPSPSPDYSTVASLFDSILRNCPNLRDLRLPRLHFKCTADDSVTSEEIVSKIIIEPLLNYLKRFGEFSTNLRITFSPRHCCEYFPCIDAQEILLSQEILRELVRVCSRIGATLYNVPSRALPPKNEWMPLSDRESFEKSVASAVAINTNLGLQDVYIPQSAKLGVEIHVTETDYTSFSLPDQLYSLQVDHRKLFIPFLQPLIFNLFQVHRPTVQELTCVWTKWCGMRSVFTELWDAEIENIPSGLDICTNFPNLKKLHLECWNNTLVSDFNDLLNGLPHLEHLCVADCGIFANDGSTGPYFDDTILLQLKNLTYLDVSGTEITDSTFENVIRHMSLKTFVSKRGYNNSNVTFKGGISTLGMTESAFKESVEEFELSKPKDCTRTDMTNFVETHFKNLRVFRLYGLDSE